MKRWDIINMLSAKFEVCNYLEIGVRDGACFKRVKVAQGGRKIGVDPDPKSKATHHMTSDEYFATEPNHIPDLAFIDGLHDAEQVRRDVYNVLQLHQRCIIVLHDCLPAGPHTAQPTKPDNADPWNGTVWKTWSLLTARYGSQCCCVQTDHGCGILALGQSFPIDCRALFTDDLYEYLSDPVGYAHAISPEAFKAWCAGCG